MKKLVLHFFELKLRILFDFFQSQVDESSKIAKIFLKKSLELVLRQKFYLASIFVLMPAETDLLLKKKGNK